MVPGPLSGYTATDRVECSAHRAQTDGIPRVTEYPTSQEGPQPVASAGGTDEAGHGKAPIAATEAVRTHATGAGTGFRRTGRALGRGPGTGAPPAARRGVGGSRRRGLRPRPEPRQRPSPRALGRFGRRGRPRRRPRRGGRPGSRRCRERRSGLPGRRRARRTGRGRPGRDRRAPRGRPAAFRRRRHPADRPRHRPRRDRARPVPGHRPDLLRRHPRLPARPAAGRRRTARRPGRFKAAPHRPAPADRRPDGHQQHHRRGDGPRRGRGGHRRARLQPVAAGRPAG